jgi:hypothetical protein
MLSPILPNLLTTDVQPILRLMQTIVTKSHSEQKVTFHIFAAPVLRCFALGMTRSLKGPTSFETFQPNPFMQFSLCQFLAQGTPISFPSLDTADLSCSSALQTSFVAYVSTRHFEFNLQNIQ